MRDAPCERVGVLARYPPVDGRQDDEAVDQQPEYHCEHEEQQRLEDAWEVGSSRDLSGDEARDTQRRHPQDREHHAHNDGVEGRDADDRRATLLARLRESAAPNKIENDSTPRMFISTHAATMFGANTFNSTANSVSRTPTGSGASDDAGASEACDAGPTGAVPTPGWITFTRTSPRTTAMTVVPKKYKNVTLARRAESAPASLSEAIPAIMLPAMRGRTIILSMFRNACPGNAITLIMS